MAYDFEKYRNGGDGLIAWAEEYMMRWDGAASAWIPHRMVEHQKKVFREALELSSRNPLTFKHRIIVFCRPRGDFKTFDVCTLLMWRFFNFPGERIVLGANSKSQSEFLQFDLITSTLLNSPKLEDIIGRDNIQRRAIQYLNPKNNDVISSIQTTTTGTGLVSNATVVAFSELYRMKDALLFTELAGSIRGVHNGMVLVDSTVASRGHILHRMYEEYKTGRNPLLYVDYYCKKHYNPNITQAELDNYKSLFLPHEFRMFFDNTWDDAGNSVFNKRQIRETRVLGVDGGELNHAEVAQALRDVETCELAIETCERESVAEGDLADLQVELGELVKRFSWVDQLYEMPAQIEDIIKIQALVDSSLVITVGLDRALPFSEHGDRTIMTTVARGSLGTEEGIKPIYFMLRLDVIPDEDSDVNIKTLIEQIMGEYQGIENIALELYQTADILAWCLRQGYECEHITSTITKQKALFTEMYTAIASGCLKAPGVPYQVVDKGVLVESAFMLEDHAAKWDNHDLWRSEMAVFEHQVKLKAEGLTFTEWFGSPEKNTQGGMKDDAVYATAIAMHAGRNVAAGQLRGVSAWPSAIANPEAAIGRW